METRVSLATLESSRGAEAPPLHRIRSVAPPIPADRHMRDTHWPIPGLAFGTASGTQIAQWAAFLSAPNFRMMSRHRPSTTSSRFRTVILSGAKNLALSSRSNRCCAHEPAHPSLKFFGEHCTARRQRVNHRHVPPRPRPGAPGRRSEHAHLRTGRAADLEKQVCATHYRDPFSGFFLGVCWSTFSKANYRRLGFRTSRRRRHPRHSHNRSPNILASQNRRAGYRISSNLGEPHLQHGREESYILDFLSARGFGRKRCQAPC